MTKAASFPRYTVVELALDLVLHAVAALLAVCGIAWLFVVAVPNGSARLLIGLTVYGVGLIGMFAASAAYNSCRPSQTKELLRRVDHAMISVMIAGTCTPFTLSAFPKSIGLLLCAQAWIVATVGVVMKLVFPRRFEGPLLMLYLITGWTFFGMSVAYADNLPKTALLLLLGGGVAYSCGAFIHARASLLFHNVAWHGLVLLGAGLHWAAVAMQVEYWRGS